LLDRFRAHLEFEAGLAAGTVKLYGDDAARFLAFLARPDDDPLPRAIERSQTAAYLAERTRAGTNRRTLAREVSGLRRFCRFARLAGLLDGEPVLAGRE
jgi:site-specific recombinase XerD